MRFGLASDGTGVEEEGETRVSDLRKGRFIGSGISVGKRGKEVFWRGGVVRVFLSLARVGAAGTTSPYQ